MDTRTILIVPVLVIMCIGVYNNEQQRNDKTA